MSADKNRSQQRRITWLRKAHDLEQFGVPLHVEGGFAFDDDAKRCVDEGLLALRRVATPSFRGRLFRITRLYLTDKGRDLLAGQPA